MHQSTIRIDPMFSESPVGIMKTHQNPIRFPSYDESPTDYLVSNSDESFESDDPLDEPVYLILLRSQVITSFFKM